MSRARPGRLGHHGQLGGRGRHRPGQPAAPGRRHPDGLARASIDGTDGGTPAQVGRRHRPSCSRRCPASQAGAPLLIAHRPGIRPGHPAGQRLHRLSRAATSCREIADTDAAAAQPPRRSPAAAAEELLAVGINVDFAPDADVLPESGPSGRRRPHLRLRSRSGPGRWSPPPSTGYQSAGLAATIKHFPGIGRLATDTHKALPSLDISCDEWNAVEAVPMRAGVDAGVALVMTGHVEMPAVGADGQSSALSSAVVTDLLRGRRPGRLQRVELPRRRGLRLVPDGAGRGRTTARPRRPGEAWPPGRTWC